MDFGVKTLIFLIFALAMHKTHIRHALNVVAKK